MMVSNFSTESYDGKSSEPMSNFSITYDVQATSGTESYDGKQLQY